MSTPLISDWLYCSGLGGSTNHLGIDFEYRVRFQEKEFIRNSWLYIPFGFGLKDKFSLNSSNILDVYRVSEKKKGRKERKILR